MCNGISECSDGSDEDACHNGEKSSKNETLLSHGVNIQKVEILHNFNLFRFIRKVFKSVSNVTYF